MSEEPRDLRDRRFEGREVSAGVYEIVGYDGAGRTVRLKTTEYERGLAEARRRVLALSPQRAGG